MKSVLAFLALFVFAFALRTEEEYQNAFTQWMQQHQKSYDHNEFRFRYATWKRNMRFIENWDAKEKGFEVAMNEFGDLSNEEFARFYTGLKTEFVLNETGSEGSDDGYSVDLPSQFDWREKNVVTHVKNQGQCGSCWSFSTTGSTEGCHALKSGNLVSLSEQNLMDCSWSYGNQGCNGGLMTWAMKYIINNGGIDTESSYSYTAQSSHNCQYSDANKGATLSSYVNVKRGDENDLQQKVYKGPTSVAIDASHSSFQFYHSGVYYEPSCSSTQLDHGVLAVGWGTSSGKDYWIVKNSWGSSWGQQGYIWMSRNRNNNCGIATTATLPKC